ncbi:homocysteine S-methyltransferase [Seongchinamella sediminis]|uniref:S-methylmethionine:homocysteine methyltransferase n=1 Tax=Seongchinamella sediminis TaxID=2283635 RepID=A0A3L7DZE9_9GAMM|nr:homocysteine S-methyltransferase [Seongchinamella sediminis]RLQ22624.1 homocysteine S-methyltransferase [Seongchinamella sediminis]
MTVDLPLLPRPLILDGGLATELEARGFDLKHKLWSARLLLEDPGALSDVHLAYLRAGAGCIISASYQASVDGFMALGLSEAEALALLDLSLQLGRDAITRYSEECRPAVRPLLAASVGPYGACLADGSEYRGHYHLDQAGLYRFHRQRFLRLAAGGADFLACETIPCIDEALALNRLIAETASPAWISFSCRDDAHLSSGESIEQAARALAGNAWLFALGVNCTAPGHITALIDRLRSAWSRRIVVYPNSGEQYCAATGRWQGTRSPLEFAAAASTWWQHGADIIGGCCRTGPAHVAALRRALA